MKDLTNQSSLADYQQFIKEICEKRGWDKRTALEKMLFLTEEVGEVAKALRKEHGIYGYPKPESTDHLAEELVDVFNFLLDLANVYGIDMADAFRQKWQKNVTRDWDGAYGQP